MTAGMTTQRTSDHAWGVGTATIAADGTILDAAFRAVGWGATLPDSAPSTGEGRTDPRRGVAIVPASTVVDVTKDPVDAVDSYLRLHLLSLRLAAPRTLNLNGIFSTLANVVWTSIGPVHGSVIDDVRDAMRRNGEYLVVNGVDKFPRMTDYVVPAGVRIADASRVRLGAHLAPGTTVMHEGFCNFNAGTLGASMVEGRISAGVIVGNGTDIGGGASIMGTLSGGGKETITVGERCLLGANSGLGISLGDDSIVEAGLYVTAGTVVTLPDGQFVKARDLSGISNALFRRNSRTGAVELASRTGAWGGLNAALHAND